MRTSRLACPSAFLIGPSPVVLKETGYCCFCCAVDWVMTAGAPVFRGATADARVSLVVLAFFATGI